MYEGRRLRLPGQAGGEKPAGRFGNPRYRDTGLHEEVQSLKERLLSDKLKHRDTFTAIVTQNKNMLAIFRYVEAISTSRQPVLITGETRDR